MVVTPKLWTLREGRKYNGPGCWSEYVMEAFCPIKRKHFCTVHDVECTATVGNFDKMFLFLNSKLDWLCVAFPCSISTKRFSDIDMPVTKVEYASQFVPQRSDPGITTGIPGGRGVQSRNERGTILDAFIWSNTALQVPEYQAFWMRYWRWTTYTESVRAHVKQGMVTHVPLPSCKWNLEHGQQILLITTAMVCSRCITSLFVMNSNPKIVLFCVFLEILEFLSHNFWVNIAAWAYAYSMNKTWNSFCVPSSFLKVL